MAVQEAVHNVIKHAGAAEVTIDIKFTNDLLVITVRDDGSGFKLAGDSGGSGLVNMKKRLSDIQGNCVMESQLGKGTTIQMSVKIEISDRPPAKRPSRPTDE
jgi:signal transduction histidine kinase